MEEKREKQARKPLNELNRAIETLCQTALNGQSIPVGMAIERLNTLWHELTVHDYSNPKQSSPNVKLKEFAD